ncbi:Rne/Rng family ribonuclease [Labrys sp. LIt4]|uniref:Rne/Rng family ribonuclease n=1 Tax=Labrys sp. LIt4 TaxID=2821355 RepID=UPI001ADF7E7C|nr:ribonuclease E/G [Labrys sp. LIt4]MBP0582960.1 Rne/Rng family ribonuclease [Labrys sp. LIt4]
MANKMLIDAAHPEETRVVVVRGNRVEEFDFEAANRKQLRGNIYLAKVTRVEPSLQAAFVEYGGNRHGFLAFSEIHPDYYQIPVADRLALLAEEQRSHRDEEDDEENGNANGASEGRRGGSRRRRGRGQNRTEAAEAETAAVVASAPEPEATDDSAGEEGGSGGIVEVGSGSDEEHVEALGGGDVADDIPERVARPRKQYKIQEVIKRRQVLLVQVVKEERGNKGAALTTYLSLAGRYSVLMPNTARGGGISRKITNAVDRKRLKAVAGELDVPDGMGVILRTAGASRTKVEIKRDFEYLLRLWENVRDLTLKSAAPTLVYEEGSLIKRSIRDLYNKDIDEVIVAGDEGYREAKDFMRMLMPSHAKNVQAYREAAPLFQRFGVEAQLDAMFSPSVSLKSGGYIVINQTEALVSIDVNSGRATREHNIEDTALKTNLEAAEEISRQLRLRDLAGLIVIDFIDMDESRNNRSVERKLKDCLKNDRARIQVGRISHFGLMEMSRQRIRTGVLESSTEVCAHCGGSGHVRSVTSVALHILRALEDQLLKSATHNLVLRTRTATALYVLNHKRGHLYALEARFGVSITVSADETIVGSQNYLIERGDIATPQEPRPVATTVQVDSFPPAEEVAEVETDVEEEEEKEIEGGRKSRHQAADGEAETGEGGRKRRRRRRRRRGNGPGGEADAQNAAANENEGDSEGEGEDAAPAAEQAAAEPSTAEDVTPPAVAEAVAASEDEGADAGKRRRRGRRGGRREAEAETPAVAASAPATAPIETAAAEAAEVAAVAEAVPEIAAEEKPKPKRRGRKQVAIKTEAESEPTPAPAPEAEPVQAETVQAETVQAEQPPAPAPAAESEPEPGQEAVASATVREVVVSNPSAYVYVDAVDPAKPKKAGWWSKK